MTNPLRPSEPVCYSSDAGFVRHGLSPLARREEIRLALEHGDWRQAAQHLHEAHTRQEWHGCGLRSWSAYVETIPLSRSYDYFLRLTITTGSAQAVSTFGAARRLALQAQQASSP